MKRQRVMMTMISVVDSRSRTFTTTTATPEMLTHWLIFVLLGRTLQHKNEKPERDNLYFLVFARLYSGIVGQILRRIFSPFVTRNNQILTVNHECMRRPPIEYVRELHQINRPILLPVALCNQQFSRSPIIDAPAHIIHTLDLDCTRDQSTST